jgi:aquaporin Z
MSEVTAPPGTAPGQRAASTGSGAPADGAASPAPDAAPQSAVSAPVTLGEISTLLSSAGVRRPAPWERDFGNLSYEWRRIVAEVFGTFFLVLVAAGAGTVDAVYGGTISRGAQVVAPALMVMAVILAIGAVSGAHLNPVVTIAFFLRGEFPLRRIPLYLVAQLAGAVVACLLLWAMFGKVGGLGATVPGPHTADVRAMWMEAVLTCGLVSTILGTASGAQNVGPLSALAVAGYIALAGLWASPVSGASMNPARSLGPQIVTGDYAHLWVYLVGPSIGMLVAVGVAYVLRGRGRDPAATRAAQGTLQMFLPVRASGVSGASAVSSGSAVPAASGTSGGTDGQTRSSAAGAPE